MIPKTQLINWLFVSSFTFFGIGKYVAKVSNFSAGNVVSVAPLLLIILFYGVDTLLNKGFTLKIGKSYLLLVLFVLFTVVFSFLEALRVGHPGFNDVNTVFLVLYLFAISHAAIIVLFYNTGNQSFNLARLIYYGMSIDIAVNLLAYAAGIQNVIHHIPGRLNLPFSQGFYATANSVAIINLIILGIWLFEDIKPSFRVFTIIHFFINLILMGGFNSRLSILMFIVCCGLILLRFANFYKLLFLLSFFTIPILLNFASLIYSILQLPVVSAVFKRLDYEDVTSFNGRRDLWQRGIDWFLNSGQGLWTGNGYQGHYTIELLEDLAEFWHRSSALGLHMHSSMFEYLLSQGVIGVLPLLMLFFLTLRHFYTNRIIRKDYAILTGVLIYLLFIFQIDIYAYITNTGAYLLFITFSTTIVNESPVTIQTYNHERIKDKHHHAVI